MELLYADDLLPGDSQKEIELRYARRKKAMMEKGLKVTVKKRQRLFLTNERTVSMIPCAVRRR